MREAKRSVGRSATSASKARRSPPVGGAPLPAQQRAFFEPLFGYDFGQVRVHADRTTGERTAHLGARAYTKGADIFWSNREPDVAAPAARGLLAHELAHTVQHGRFRGHGASSRGKLEAEADSAATAVLSGRRADVRGTASPDLALRQDHGAGSGVLELEPPSLGDSYRRSRFETTQTEWSLRNFDTGQHALRPEHQADVDAIVQELTAHPLAFGEYVTIWGATDQRGTTPANEELGQRRADEVRRTILARVPQPELEPQVRAYSSGEAAAARSGDVPEYRCVTVTISRRSYRSSAMVPPLREPGAPQLPVPPPIDLRLPRGYIPLPGPQQLPPDFWRMPPALPPRDIQQEVIRGLSRALGEALHADELARVVGRLAGRLGMNEQEVTRRLRELAQEGGEAAIRAALRKLLESIPQ